MNEYESIKCKVLKLQALVERGEGGEAANAKRLLDKILESHGFTLEKILSEKEKKKWYEFKANNEYEKRLLLQCYFKILDVNKVSFRHYRNTYDFELTAFEAAELKNYYEWHKIQLSKEIKNHLKDMVEAYIIKHNITSSKDDDDETDYKPLTPSEKARLFRISLLADGLEDVSYVKMIK